MNGASGGDHFWRVIGPHYGNAGAAAGGEGGVGREDGDLYYHTKKTNGMFIPPKG